MKVCRIGFGIGERVVFNDLWTSNLLAQIVCTSNKMAIEDGRNAKDTILYKH